MIFKRYGSTLQSVDLNFDSKALNELGFRRNREQSIPEEELTAGYDRIAVHEIGAEAEGPVQDETEQLLLDRVEARLREVERALGEGSFLVLDNADGNDYPKTRQVMRNVIVEGENRLHFSYEIRPLLRMVEYRRRS